VVGSLTYEIIGEGQYRVLAQGWWTDVEYRWDRATDDWRVMIPDTNAYGRIFLFDIALAANDVIGGGEVPREKLVRADTGGRLIDGRAEFKRRWSPQTAGSRASVYLTGRSDLILRNQSALRGRQSQDLWNRPQYRYARAFGCEGR